MSESTEKLKTTVEGASEVLTDTATVAEQLSSQATELAEEAAGHKPPRRRVFKNARGGQ